MKTKTTVENQSSSTLVVTFLFSSNYNHKKQKPTNRKTRKHWNCWVPSGYPASVLAEKQSREDAILGNYYLNDATRRLSIVSTDNRRVANAARLRWERVLQDRISSLQQGVLPGRSILSNHGRGHLRGIQGGHAENPMFSRFCFCLFSVWL